VVLLLGAWVSPASPDPEDVTPFNRLGALVRVERVAGAGHFLQEERPDEIVRLLVRPRILAVHDQDVP
jgi:pimeloyl-ACP methyl ester carboxylesterase